MLNCVVPLEPSAGGFTCSPLSVDALSLVKEVEAASEGGLDFPACLVSIIGKFNSASEDGGGILPRPMEKKQMNSET